MKEGGSGEGSGSGCFQGRLMGFADGLDISCERKREVKNDIKVYNLSNDKMELCTDRASLVAQS